MSIPSFLCVQYHRKNMSSPVAEKDGQPTSAARDTQTSSLTSVLSVVYNRGTVQLIKRCFITMYQQMESGECIVQVSMNVNNTVQ